MSIGFLLVDDHEVVREGLRRLVEARSGWAVVGEARDGRQAVSLARRLRPHVMLLDVELPVLGGADVARLVGRELPGVRIIALSAHAEPWSVRAMAAAGAVAYVLKGCTSDELFSAMEGAVAGRPAAGPLLRKPTQPRPDRGTAGRRGLQALTLRQRQVLELLVEGGTRSQIAARLGISVKTVESHRAHVMDKMECRSVAGLVRRALRAGILTSDERP